MEAGEPRPARARARPGSTLPSPTLPKANSRYPPQPTFPRARSRSPPQPTPSQGLPPVPSPAYPLFLRAHLPSLPPASFRMRHGPG